MMYVLEVRIKMRKQFLLPLIIILVVTLILPVGKADAKGVVQINFKQAMASGGSGDTYAYVFVGNLPFDPDPSVVRTFGYFMYWNGSDYVFESWEKELTSKEFKWSFGACKLSTMIDTSSGPALLVVKWVALPPTETTHMNEVLPSPVNMHIIMNTASRREASATLTCDGVTISGLSGEIVHATWIMITT